MKKRYAIEFTVEAEDFSDEWIKDQALQELTCMVPFPEDIDFHIKDNPWHTGTPTEKGTYLVNDCLNDYGISYFDGEKFSYVYFPNKGVIRLWQRIEPYKEKV